MVASRYYEHRTCHTLDAARLSLEYLQDSGRKGIIRQCKVWTIANGYSHKVKGYRVLAERPTDGREGT